MLCGHECVGAEANEESPTSILILQINGSALVGSAGDNTHDGNRLAASQGDGRK